MHNKQSGPVRSEFYTSSPVRSIWSGPKIIHYHENINYNIFILIHYIILTIKSYSYIMLINTVQSTIIKIGKVVAIV